MVRSMAAKNLVAPEGDEIPRAVACLLTWRKECGVPAGK